MTGTVYAPAFCYLRHCLPTRCATIEEHVVDYPDDCGTGVDREADLHAGVLPNCAVAYIANVYLLRCYIRRVTII